MTSIVSLSRVATAAMAFCVAGCATPMTDEEIVARMRRTQEIARIREVDAAFAANGRKLVDGIPDGIAADSFWPGDRLLFGIESFDGAEVERFYLLFESLGDPPRPGEVELVQHDKKGAVSKRRKLVTDFRRVQVTLFDAELRELRSAGSEVACLVHEIGMFPYARAMLADPRLRTIATRVRRPLYLLDAWWGESIEACLMRESMGNAALRDLVGRLSISPGWFEGISLLGARLSLSFGTYYASKVPQPIGGLPVGEDAIECPTSISGKTPLLIANVVLVPPIGPLAMSGGIACVTGYRWAEPDRRFVMRLLGVARGKVP